MKNTRRALLGVAALFLTCGFSNAATISFSFTQIGPQTTDFGPTAFTTSQFDGSLGTLTGVSVAFTADLSTILTVTNNGTSGSSSGNANTRMQVAVDDSSSFTVVSNLLAGTGNFFSNASVHTLSLDSDPFGYSLAQGASTTSGLDDPGPASKTYSFNSSSTGWGNIMTEFTGTGNYSLFAKTFTSTVVNNTGGNTAAAQTTTGVVTGTVTYTYTPGGGAPEPATMFLMGSALVGVGLLRKRIRS